MQRAKELASATLLEPDHQMTKDDIDQIERVVVCIYAGAAAF